MEYIKDWLDNMEKLTPIPAGISPKLYEDHTIKICLFDIYGTLLISESGDIDKAVLSPENLKNAFEISGVKLISSAKNEFDILNRVLGYLKQTVLISQETSRKNNIPHPEIEIREIWKAVLQLSEKHNLIYNTANIDITRLAMAFELLSNRVYPMPGFNDIINKLKLKKMPIGLISNAQFYTPVLLNYFISGRFRETDRVDKFEKDLTVFSYQLRRGKPDDYLFLKLVPVLKKKFNINPEEVLFIGNDMLNDIHPAKITGFKTALFAGDKRSLRLRSDRTELENIKPDFIITELLQLLEIIG
jgi:putative hydrolase of the HAD superfamily